MRLRRLGIERLEWKALQVSIRFGMSDVKSRNEQIFRNSLFGSCWIEARQAGLGIWQVWVDWSAWLNFSSWAASMSDKDSIRLSSSVVI